MGRWRSLLAAVLLTFLMSALPIKASETVTYAYDARGRLVSVSRSGTVNNGVAASYSYDKADNRTNVTVTGAGGYPPAFSINDVSVTEGGVLTFTVTKTGTTSSSFSVNYASADGTAGGSDYTAASGTLTFAAADTTKTFTVATIDDAAVESAETINVTLSGATGGATISDASGVGTINDNEIAPAPSFSINDVSVTEGAALVFTVTKSGSTSSTFTVNYASWDASAVAGSDYTGVGYYLTFAPADVTKTITVPTIDDAIVENTETLGLTLYAPSGDATISRQTAVGTINDNDTATPCSGVSFAVNDKTVVEGAPLLFTISKAGSTSSSCSISYATANGTALAPGQYTATSGTLTFTSAQTSQTVSVTTIDKSRLSGTKTMYLNLSSPSGGGAIADSQGIGSINASGGSGCPLC